MLEIHITNLFVPQNYMHLFCKCQFQKFLHQKKSYNFKKRITLVINNLLNNYIHKKSYKKLPKQDSKLHYNPPRTGD